MATRFPVIGKTPMLIGKRQSHSQPEFTERSRREKFKSVIHLGPSRQEVMEHYLVEHEHVINRKSVQTSPSPNRRGKEKRARFRSRLSSMKDEFVDAYLQSFVNSDVDSYEYSLERSNSEELQKSLKHSSRGLGCLLEDDMEPLEKFKQCVGKVIWINRFLQIGRENRQNNQKDWKFMSWTLVYDDLGLSKRSYADIGLSFDPSEFRLKRQRHISNEAKSILCMDPTDRTRDQLQIARTSLEEAVEAFKRFPNKMKEAMVRTAWYEQFGAGRVIIRQGHTADNYYMILCGTAVVTITEEKNGEVHSVTVNILEKGYCFGELALIHQSKRTATVTCRDDVELLALRREDFIDIFMKTERGQEQEHITFLRELNLIRDWPIDKIPHNNPKICIFTYVGRDRILCRDSNKSDWMVVIKTGTCRVLKNLNETKSTLSRSGLANTTHSPPRQATESPRAPSPISPRTASPTPASPPRQRRPGVATMRVAHFERSKANPSDTVQVPHVVVPDPPQPEHMRKLEETYQRLHPKLKSEQHRKILDAVFDERRILPPLGVENVPPVGTTKIYMRTTRDDVRRNEPQIFIEIAKLGPGDIFGLEQIVMAGIKETTNCILVSDGAECILINRKFFRKHLTEDIAKRIRTELQPIPSEDTLQSKLQTQTNWDAFRHMTVSDQLAYKRHVHNTLLKY